MGYGRFTKAIFCKDEKARVMSHYGASFCNTTLRRAFHRRSQKFYNGNRNGFQQLVVSCWKVTSLSHSIGGLPESVGLELEEEGSLACYGFFREAVLRTYQHRCAICGYDLKLGCADLGLEAAHIKWRAAGGPDTVNNGLALCALHHMAFDLGAITLTFDYRIMVSEHVYGTKHLETYLLDYMGKPILDPLKATYLPQHRFIKWHQKEVFRFPNR